jgi:hypothetical protein
LGEKSILLGVAQIKINLFYHEVYNLARNQYLKCIFAQFKKKINLD